MGGRADVTTHNPATHQVGFSNWEVKLQEIRQSSSISAGSTKTINGMSNDQP